MRTASKQYLRRVCRWIQNPRKRSDTYKELRSHILDKIDHLVESGRTFSEAEAEVLKDMPLAHWYGYKLRRAQYPFWRRHLMAFTGSFFAGVSLLVAIVCVYAVQSHYLPLLERLTLSDAKYVDMFEKDLELISKISFFVSEKKLSAKNYVYRENKHMFSAEKLKALEDIYTKVQRASQSTGVILDKRTFLEKMKSIPLDSISTEWLAELKNYDSLSGFTPEDENVLAQAGPQSMIKRIAAYSSLKTPMHVSDVANYIYIRALQLCLKNQCIQAMKELEHTAKLIYTTESLASHMVAVALLKREKFLIEKFQLNHKVPLSDDDLMAYRRVSWGWYGIVAMILKKQTPLERWEPYLKQSTGFCSQMGERPLGYYNGLSDFIEDPWVFEASFSENIAWERVLLREWHTLCDLKEFLPMIEKTTEHGALFSYENYQVWLMTQSHFTDWKIPFPNASRIPYVRQVAGFRLMSFAVPNYWVVYEKLDEERQRTALVD